MWVRVCGGICVFILAFSFSFSYDLKLKASVRLSQEEEILYMSSGLGVTEDGFFIIADRRGSNIKIYGPDGRLIKVWGRQGVGPDEVLGPCYLYYDSSHLVFFDIGQMKIFVYEITKNFDFKKVRQFPSLSGPNDLRLLNGQTWIPEYIRDRSQKEYAIYSIDNRSEKIQYILPVSVFLNLYSHKEWPVIGGNYYCLPAEDVVYCVWEGNLRIMRLDLKTLQHQFFGKTTDNYVKPYVSHTFRESFQGPRRSHEDYVSNKRKMCYVSGLFGDNKFVGLVYHRFDPKISLWTTYIQFYSPTGEFINEILLPEAITYDDMIERFFYYSREKKLFFFLSRTLDEKFKDQFRVLTYSLSSQAK